MKLRKQHVILFVFAALMLGIVGFYVGGKVSEPNQSTSQGIIPEFGSNKNTTNIPNEMEKIGQAFELIKEHYIEDVDDNDLIEGAIQGMLETLEDPYSTYMDLETMDRFNEQIESSFEGIGAEVSMVNGKVTIVAPIKDSPAEEVGLRPNDQILKIDNEDIEGLDLNAAVERIRGEKGSTVLLDIERPSVSEPFQVEITRDTIPIETVYSSLETIDGKKTGMIEITSFAESTSADFKEALLELEEDSIEGLVIDVRGNPGGLLSAVEEILGEFIPKDIPYLQIEDQSGKKTPYFSKLAEKKGYPISILIDEGSASASEILAVSLKEMDYEVVGVASFGKGTVQQAVPLGDGSTVKLTFYKWLSPNGNWINEVGVEPTKEQKQPEYFYSHPIQLDEPLILGDSGEMIENIQTMLSGLGYETGKDLGEFNETMESTVKEFQAAHDLSSTGEIDEETAGMIEAEIVDRIRSGKDDLQLEKAYELLYK